jgi:hypothetical protein
VHFDNIQMPKSAQHLVGADWAGFSAKEGFCHLGESPAPEGDLVPPPNRSTRALASSLKSHKRKFYDFPPLKTAQFH